MKEGDKFEHEFVITQKIQRDFIALFHDENPLHINHEFAKNKGFDSVVMQGNILGGFLSYFIGECLPVKNVIIHSQEIKYVKPIYVDDVLLLIAEIRSVFESVNVIELSFSFSKKTNSITVAKGKIQIGII